MQIHHFLCVDSGKGFLRDIFSVFFAVLIQKRHSYQRIRISGIIQIKIGIACHGKNFTGIHPHDNTAHIVGSVSGMIIVFIFLVKFQQIFFYNALNIGIYRGNNGISVLRCYRSSLQVRVVVQITVNSSRSSGKFIIIIFLKSVFSLIVTGGKSNHITGKRVPWIDPFILLLKPDSFHQRTFLILKLHKTGYFIVGKSFCQHMIAGGFLVFFYIGTYTRRIQSKFTPKCI